MAFGGQNLVRGCFVHRNRFLKDKRRGSFPVGTEEAALVYE